jgi:hypothetical protein
MVIQLNAENKVHQHHQNSGQNTNIRTFNVPLKISKFQPLGNDANKSKSHCSISLKAG